MPFLKRIKNKIERPDYYYINGFGSISRKKWKDDKVDNTRYNTGKYFVDYEDALEELTKK